MYQQVYLSDKVILSFVSHPRYNVLVLVLMFIEFYSKYSFIETLMVWYG